MTESPSNPSSTAIIAEAGVNHNGDLKLARRLVEAAARAGADYVKFQTFRSEALASPAASKAEYQKGGSRGGDPEGQLEMLKRLELSPAGHRELMEHCRSCGIRFLSSAFDAESLEFLAGLNLDWAKVPSGELTNPRFLRRVASQGVPVLLSTGMATLEEVEAALAVLTGAGLSRDRIVVLHCTTSYPAPVEEANLRAMLTLRDRLGVRVGYSDHTLGIEVAVAAVALGAEVIEKHLTLDRSLEGPDHRSSLVPEEFEAMVRAIRNVEKALGDGRKRPSPSEAPNIPVARKSIHLGRDLKRGHVLSEGDLVLLRPGDGIPPGELEGCVGRRLVRDCPGGHQLGREDLE